MLVSKNNLNEFFRYFSVGLIAASLDLFFLFILVQYFHIWYLSATTLSFVVITCFGYFGQKYFTFRDLSRNHKKQIPVFFIVAGIGIAINIFLMFLFVSIIGIWYIAANVIAKIIVLAWNFLANKNLVFIKSQETDG